MIKYDNIIIISRKIIYFLSERSDEIDCPKDSILQYRSLLNSLNFTKKNASILVLRLTKKGNIDQGIHKGKSKVARNEKYNVDLLMHKIFQIVILFTSTFH